MSIVLGLAAALAVAPAAQGAVVVAQTGEACQVQALGESTCQWVDEGGNTTGSARVRVYSDHGARPEYFGVEILPSQIGASLPGQAAVEVSGIGYAIQSHYDYPFVRDMKSSLFVLTSGHVRTYGEVLAEFGVASNPQLGASLDAEFWHLYGEEFYQIVPGYQLMASGDTWSARLEWAATSGGSVDAVFFASLAGIPEPGQWLLMILGFAAIGMRMRSAPARLSRA